MLRVVFKAFKNDFSFMKFIKMRFIFRNPENIEILQHFLKLM